MLRRQHVLHYQTSTVSGRESFNKLNSLISDLSNSIGRVFSCLSNREKYQHLRIEKDKSSNLVFVYNKGKYISDNLFQQSS